MKPRLLAALAGTREVPPQTPFAEAWLAYALFYYEKPLSLDEVIESADSIDHAIPNPDEVAWAFLRLRKRGWLVVQEDSYGLTAEGRRMIESVMIQGGTQDRVGRLTAWIMSHPPPGEDQ